MTTSKSTTHAQGQNEAGSGPSCLEIDIMDPTSKAIVQTTAVAGATGIAGWVLENTLFGQRYSALAPNFPFLPVYAAGGAAISLLQPRIANMHPLARFLIYAGALTAIEGTAGIIERHQGRMSWDYHGSPIDLPHAAAWGALGLLADYVIRDVGGR